MNLMDTFCETVKKQPNHLAIIGSGKEDIKSYSQLQEKIEFVAARLTANGVGPSSCVGLHYPSGLGYIILTYAIWRCGACVVPIPVELVPEEKHRIGREICLDAIISQSGIYSAMERFQNGKPIPLVEDIIVAPAKRFRQHPPQFFSINPAFLRFTSGTTGTSKGIVLSHETVYDRIHAANEGLCIGPEDRITWLLSMAYHFTVSIVSYLSFGATIILCKNHLGATIIQTTASNKGTIIYGSPVHYQFMAQDRSALMLPDLRLAISTTTSLQPEIAEAFYHRFKIPLSEAYGIIEVGLPCMSLNNDKCKLGSVGRVLPAYELHMEDVGLGNELRAISLRGKGFLDAYYEPWQMREEIMPNGWFVTNDLGRLDDEGYLYISGRSKDVINVGGIKFFPQEVEKVLESHPAVKEACVFPHHHKRLGDVPHAEVVLAENIQNTPTVIEVKDFCRQRLTGYKIPEEIRFVNTLVRTASGKLIRSESTINKRRGATYED